MCIDETSVNNQVQCIDNEFCPKWLYFVNIKRKTNGSMCLDGNKNLIANSLEELVLPNNAKSSFNDWIEFYSVKTSNKFKVLKLKLPYQFFDLNLINVENHQNFNDILIFLVIFLIPIIFLSFFIYIYYQSILISSMFLILFYKFFQLV